MDTGQGLPQGHGQPSMQDGRRFNFRLARGGVMSMDIVCRPGIWSRTEIASVVMGEVAKATRPFEVIIALPREFECIVFELNLQANFRCGYYAQARAAAGSTKVMTFRLLKRLVRQMRLSRRLVVILDPHAALYDANVALCMGVLADWAQARVHEGGSPEDLSINLIILSTLRHRSFWGDLMRASFGTHICLGGGEAGEFGPAEAVARCEYKEVVTSTDHESRVVSFRQLYDAAVEARASLAVSRGKHIAAFIICQAHRDEMRGCELLQLENLQLDLFSHENIANMMRFGAGVGYMQTDVGLGLMYPLCRPIDIIVSADMEAHEWDTVLRQPVLTTVTRSEQELENTRAYLALPRPAWNNPEFHATRTVVFAAWPDDRLQRPHSWAATRDLMELVFEAIAYWPGRRLADVPVEETTTCLEAALETRRQLAELRCVVTGPDGYELTPGFGLRVFRALQMVQEFGPALLFALITEIEDMSLRVAKTLIRMVAVLRVKVDMLICPKDELEEAGPAGDPPLDLSEAVEGAAEGVLRGHSSRGALWTALVYYERRVRAKTRRDDPVIVRERYFAEAFQLITTLETDLQIAGNAAHWHLEAPLSPGEVLQVERCLLHAYFFNLTEFCFCGIDIDGDIVDDDSDNARLRLIHLSSRRFLGNCCPYLDAWRQLEKLRVDKLYALQFGIFRDRHSGEYLTGGLTMVSADAVEHVVRVLRRNRPGIGLMEILRGPR